MIDSSNVTVVVANHHAEMLKVISAFLRQHFSLIAAVPTGDDLIRVVAALQPNVIVSEIGLPVGGALDAMLALKRLGIDPLDTPVFDGLDIVLAFRSAGLGTPFVLLGQETQGVEQFLDLGATAYVHKADVHGDLREAIVSAVQGHRFISRSVVRKS